jgi:hypothetical protein
MKYYSSLRRINKHTAINAITSPFPIPALRNVEEGLKRPSDLNNEISDVIFNAF